MTLLIFQMTLVLLVSLVCGWMAWRLGHSAHVFSPTLFTMLMVMALFTTMTTVPALN